MFSLYSGNSFSLTIISNVFFFLPILIGIIGWIKYKNNIYSTAGFIFLIIGMFGPLMGMLMAKEDYYDYQYQKIENNGYKIIHTYSGFSEKSMPDTSSCQEMDSIKYIDADFNEVNGIAKANIVICK